MRRPYTGLPAPTETVSTLTVYKGPHAGVRFLQHKGCRPVVVKGTGRLNRISVAGMPGDFWSRLLEAGVRWQGLIRKDKWAREATVAVMEGGPGCQSSAWQPRGRSSCLLRAKVHRLLPSETPSFFRSEVTWCSVPPNNHRSSYGARQVFFGLCSHSHYFPPVL